jgi:hypothetical protein
MLFYIYLALPQRGVGGNREITLFLLTLYIHAVKKRSCGSAVFFILNTTYLFVYPPHFVAALKQ